MSVFRGRECCDWCKFVSVIGIGVKGMLLEELSGNDWLNFFLLPKCLQSLSFCSCICAEKLLFLDFWREVFREAVLLTMASGRNWVWFVGDSWVHWLKEYCEGRGIASDMGLQNVFVRWFGQRGMRWHQVLPCLQSLDSDVHPDVIVIHCGGNDLGTLRAVSLIRLMKHDLRKIQEMFPRTSIVFSTIAERQQWAWSRQFGHKFEKARRNLNKVMSAFMRNYGMLSIRHYNIHFADQSLFRRDGVHLTDHGNARFLSNVRDVLMHF